MGDINGDGVLDVVMMTHYRATWINGRTGQAVEMPFHSGRNFGYFRVINVDEEPSPEIVLVIDRSNHVELLDPSRPPKKTLVWQRRQKELDLDPGEWLTGRTTYARPHSVEDLNGDGKVEVAYALQNEHDDLLWSLVILDAATGEKIVDRRQEYLRGIDDLDGDGVYELFCVEATGAFPPTFSYLRIYHLVDTKLREAARIPYGQYQLGGFEYRMDESQPARDTDNVLTADCDGDGRKEILVAQSDQIGEGFPKRFAAYCLEGGGEVPETALRKVWSFEVPQGRALQLLEVSRSAAGISFRFLDLAAGKTLQVGMDGAVAENPSGPSWPGYVTLPTSTDLDGDGKAEIVAQNSRGEIEVLSFRGGRLEPLWKRPGQGIPFYAAPYEGPCLGPAAADLNGDGKKELLVSQDTPTGVGSLAAYSSSGKLVWRRVFPGVMTPADRRAGGIDYFNVGRFDALPGPDVLVMVHGERPLSFREMALGGRFGQLIWRRDHFLIPAAAPQDPNVKTEEKKAYLPYLGGLKPAIVDVNQDGADDVVQVGRSCYFLEFSGADGRPLLEAIGPMSTDPRYGANYAVPVVARFVKEGAPCAYLAGHPTTMMVSLAGQPLWSRPVPRTQPYMPAVMDDLDGDGGLDLALVSDANNLLFVGGATGKPIASLADAHPVTDIVAVDLDGDGRRECVFGEGANVTAANTQGVLWTVSLPAQVFGVIVSDVDGDGRGELIASARDGTIRVLD